MKKIILVGAGGHAKSCLDVIKSTKKFKILGFIDNNQKGYFEKYKILGGDDFLEKIKDKKKFNLALTFGQIKNYKKKASLFNKFAKLGFRFPSIISKNAIVSNEVSFSDGTIVFNGAIVNRGSTIGKNCIINSGALIEHDTKIGNNTHISTKAILNGSVKVGNNTFVGSGCIVKEGTFIGNNCVIGMGKLIKKNIKNNSFIK